MTPKQIANFITNRVEGSGTFDTPEKRYEYLVKSMLNLAIQLIASEPGYGHAERLHNLTGGKEQ